MKGRGLVFSGDTETDDLDDDTWLDHDLDDEPWLGPQMWLGPRPWLAVEAWTDADPWQDDGLWLDAELWLDAGLCLSDLLNLKAAIVRAAWSNCPATAPATRAAPAAEARADRQAKAPTTRRNAPPANMFEALRRLLDCNRQELAARLGVSRYTLHRWERGQIPGPARARVADLMRATLAAAQADWTMGPDFSPAALQLG